MQRANFRFIALDKKKICAIVILGLNLARLLASAWISCQPLFIGGLMEIKVTCRGADLLPLDAIEWREIKSHPGYFVSNTGEIKSIKSGKILRPAALYNTGYLHVCIYNNGKEYSYTIHRLVASAFIPNPENKCDINHKDGNKKNNTVSNLEWATRSENMKHSFAVLGNKGGSYGKFGKDHPRAVAVYKIDPYTNEILEEFGSIADARLKYPKAKNISAVCNGKRELCIGYKWQYAQ